MAVFYNKLVRDKIPEIIKKAGKTPEYEILSQAEYIEMLEKNLMKKQRNIMQAKMLKN